MMKSILVIVVLVIVGQITIDAKQNGAKKNHQSYRCEKKANGRVVCFCGKNRVQFDRLKGERCVNGQVIQRNR